MKTYLLKWYDWHAGHYNELECETEQVNPTFSALNAKAGISDITINEIKEPYQC